MLDTARPTGAPHGGVSEERAACCSASRHGQVATGRNFAGDHVSMIFPYISHDIPMIFQ